MLASSLICFAFKTYVPTRSVKDCIDKNRKGVTVLWFQT